MLSYYLKCTKKKKKTPKVAKTKDGRIMFWSICAVCNSNKSRLIKEEKASGLFNYLRNKNTVK